MKNSLLFLFYFFSIIYLHCQVKVIDIEDPGSLSKLLGSEINSITELKINGKINSVDYTTLKSMKKLSVLDLSNSGADDGILPAQAFSSCNVLKSITLPASLVTISDFAFQNAYNVSIDASKCTQLKNIGLSAFHSVQGKVTLPDQLEFLSNNSFSSFNGTVLLPKNLKSIGEYAFSNTKIKNIDLSQAPELHTLGNSA
ncbi:leucine-rich repeat domain-containing protein, partial [uncultured Apibacter sp.]|uniref:leucine-rich repeat domain-containing protein n=1 Tax=uncultured Apibacter sp. TaxID=1778616 RepID=UPI0025E66031